MFHPIDFAAWDRAEYYQHYMNNARYVMFNDEDFVELLKKF